MRLRLARDTCGNVLPMFPPSRIVCLTEETVETLYLLGEDARIVGVSMLRRNSNCSAVTVVMGVSLDLSACRKSQGGHRKLDRARGPSFETTP